MKVVVLGAGESGVGTALLAKKKDYEVFVSDFGSIAEKYKNVLKANDITWEEKQHTEAQILNANVVVKSPVIPDKTPNVQKVLNKNIKVISEIEFAFPYAQNISIAITGSNGKKTTTQLTDQLLKQSGLNVGLAGNVG